MSNYTAIRRLQFCAGHRVHKHESKCNNMHGHNYVLFIHARPLEDLDDIGRVVDFSVLKKLMGGWIDENWDHGFIFFEQDIMMDTLFHNNIAINSSQKFYVMPTNPTAENMAHHLLHDICPHLFRHWPIEIFKIILHETENCSVEVTLSNYVVRGHEHLPGGD